VRVTHDVTHDGRHDDPIISEADVIGLYPPDKAVAASRWTATIDGQTEMDD
jgi:hypothetical protein